MSDWPLKKISDVAEFLNQKRIPLKSLDRQKRQGEYPYYGASGIVDYIDDYVFDGTFLLISEDGENLRTRNTPVAFKASGKFWVNNHAHILAEKEEGILDYLEYYFSKVDLKPYLTGAVQPKLNKANLDSIEIPVPEKEERLVINKILNSMTKKIELNRQTNQTLEQIAQAIFKSWFVDFEPVKAKIQAKQNGQDPELAAMCAISGLSKSNTASDEEQLKGLDDATLQQLKATAALFPDALVESELGKIPEGWEVKSISDIGSVVTGKTPPKKVEQAYDDVGFPFITPTDIDDSVFVTSTRRFLTPEGQLAVKNSKIEAGTICVTCIGSQMGKATVSPKDAFTNQQINSIAVYDDSLRNYLLLNLRNRREEIYDIGSSGSTMPIINKTTFEKLDVISPNLELLNRFDSFVEPQMKKILGSALESILLADVRDLLLPKLLSGEFLSSELAKGV